MSLYQYLDVKPDATTKEIRKAYRRLAKKHHPDKNNGKSSDTFIKITNAYDILSNAEEKRKYDKFLRDKESGNVSKEDLSLYSMLEDLMNKYYLGNVLNLMNMFYDKDKFKSDLDSLNFYKIYKKFKLNIFRKDPSSLNITKNVYFTFEEVYNNKPKILKTVRLLDNSYQDIIKVIHPDPYYQELVWEEEGEQIGGVTGDLIINLKITDSKEFEIYDDYNLLYIGKFYCDNKQISNTTNDNLENQIYIILPDNAKLYISQETDMINNHFYFKGKGLMNESSQRGDLFIKVPEYLKLNKTDKVNVIAQ